MGLNGCIQGESLVEAIKFDITVAQSGETD
jgi:hypothetical protein